MVKNSMAMKIPINKKIAALILVVAIVIFASVSLAIWLSARSALSAEKYQAVFLANGQVYFGRAEKINSRYVRLSDIYYFQAKPENQESEGQLPDVALTKLGSELHGPEDEMLINREQILFIENLRDDSKVVSAIKGSKQKE